MKAKLVTGLVFLLTGGAIQAQESASFKVRESALNAGGSPADGIVLTSSSFRVSLSAIGDALSGASPASASFRVAGGFLSAYPPPGEVINVQFTDAQTLTWDAEGSAGAYNVYRDLVSTLTGTGFGACLLANLPDLMAIEMDTPASGQGYFYLLTVQNLLDEEGTKGFGSSGERGNVSPCP